MEQAQRVKKFCVDEYYGKPPYSDYVGGIGISRVGRENMKAASGEKGDYCVVVRLQKRLPRRLPLLKEKDGVKIFVEYIGVIRAL